ncbi:MAG: phosphate ABC transporter substrate-binding protein, partial [Pedobacter sp.]
MFLSVILFSCNSEKNVEQRTSGSVNILVDETVADIVDQEVEVFYSDYPDAKIKLIKGSESKILTNFLNDTTRVIVLSRTLTDQELKFYERRKIPVNIDRFAVDGIALITGKNNIDSNITVKEVIEILKGESATSKRIVFDNAYSSTVNYFKRMMNVKEFSSRNVFTLQSNKDVIDFVGKNPDYIGVIGVNWLYNNASMTVGMDKIMLMNVKNLPGKQGADAYYKPIQRNLMTGKYPFLRNVCIINAEGKSGLGTGFATWLTSPRGQLIVLKSGLGPHKL